MIRAVAVLGAGTMGAQLAAMLASAGLDVLVLDVSAQAARDGLTRLKKVKPDPWLDAGAAARIHTAGFDEGLPRIAGCDWVLEAITEKPEIKRALLSAVDAVRGPDALISTTTSALPVGALADGRSESFRRHWFGTHFFNPPRYLRLLELIPGPDTDPESVSRFAEFADRRLGKGVVVAKDVPGFIGNHIAMFGAFRILQAWSGGPWSITEIDEITGPLLGRPKSATFRTLDLAGLDVLGQVSRTFAGVLPEGSPWGTFTLPPAVDELINRGWLGEKTGQGFYKRVTLPDGQSRILALDARRFEYVPTGPVELPIDSGIARTTDVRERIRRLWLDPGPVGAFVRSTLGSALGYAALVAPRIAHHIDDVDRVMRWGFGWELGPFETIDAIGADEVAAVLPSVPPGLQDVLARAPRTYRPATLPAVSPQHECLRQARECGAVVRSTPGASLVDLGEGVLAVEFHSKLNVIGADAVTTIEAGLESCARGFRALVIGTEATHFSAGADLRLVLEAARHHRWGEIEDMVRVFQRMTWAIKYADVPVIVAPLGLVLGGGCEITLHADRVQAAAETYIGLVETGVGLIPAGGGTKEMLVRATAGRPASTPLLHLVQPIFETLALARVSTGAPDARRLGFLREVDGITMNRDRLFGDAKERARGRAAEDYRARAHNDAIPAGGEDLEAALSLGAHLAWRAGRATEYDVVVARRLAWVLAGGSLPHATTVSEEYLLDLEREAFLGLCGETRTIARIEHMLKTGKPLRN